MANEARSENKLLRQLSPSEYAKLEPDLEEVAMHFKETLFEHGKPIKYVYFPTSGVVSLVTDMRDEVNTVETGTIGREGMVGIPAFLGAKKASGRAFVQVAGSSLRLETSRFLSAANSLPALNLLLKLYTNALMAMVAQSAACNRLHPVEARMAKWLLLTHDRVEGDQFALTQEFIAQMLGVRRPIVNVAGRALQSANLIEYVRGKVTIRDRDGLEEASCECYASVTAEMASVRLPRR